MCEQAKLDDVQKEFIGSSSDSGPFIAVMLGERKRWKLEGRDNMRKPDAVKDFLTQVKSGKTRPSYRSEPKPAAEVGEDGITTLVGSTFGDHVMDPSKDYFVAFTSEWCQHCKDLAPIWVDLQKKIVEYGWDKKGLVIAKMDGAKNECEEEIKGYPHLVLYPAVPGNQKLRKRQLFTGTRDLGKLTDFLMYQAVNLEDEVHPDIAQVDMSRFQSKGKGKGKPEAKSEL